MLQEIIQKIVKVLQEHFKLDKLEVNINLETPMFDGFEEFSNENDLSEEEAIVLAMAILPNIHPYFFNEIQAQIKDSEIQPNLFFYQESSTGVLFPLLQVALLIIYKDYGWAYSAKAYELTESKIFKMGIVRLQNISTIEVKNNLLLQIITIDEQKLKYILTKKESEFSLSPQFPAQKISTLFNWNDLVLQANTIELLQDIIDFDTNKGFFDADPELQKIIKPGYKALFFGASGTGKTLTASLIGKQLKKDVYRVDLSMMVSKYIGETEKNLESLFSIAEHKNWILFFDEADALFGTRTTVSDAHDRYANQEVSFLLQRIENFNGIIILASNLKNNIDKAFSRRFQSVIEFKNPREAERELLWNKSISKTMCFETDFISEIAKKYDITGGSIVNVIQFATLRAIVRKDKKLSYNDIITGIGQELAKDGRTL
jgi:SpoVK/Ycf46/Vps4 family AAA+-type ATPase